MTARALKGLVEGIGTGQKISTLAFTGFERITLYTIALYLYCIYVLLYKLYTNCVLLQFAIRM